MNGLTKALAAEFTGTFALIFLGAGAATALGGGQTVAIALAHVEWAPRAGQVGGGELTGEPGFRRMEAHDEAPIPQHRV
jgi:glycerol uptake facilitator-like aquaporin